MYATSSKFPRGWPTRCRSRNKCVTLPRPIAARARLVPSSRQRLCVAPSPTPSAPSPLAHTRSSFCSSPACIRRRLMRRGRPTAHNARRTSDIQVGRSSLETRSLPVEPCFPSRATDMRKLNTAAAFHSAINLVYADNARKAQTNNAWSFDFCNCCAPQSSVDGAVRASLMKPASELAITYRDFGNLLF